MILRPIFENINELTSPGGGGGWSGGITVIL